MPALRSRAASALAELLVALVLTGVAGVIGTGLLIAAERRTRGASARSQDAQLARDIDHVLANEVTSADWGSLALAGDTALDVDAHVGASVACIATGHVVVLPAATTSGPAPFTAWRQVPEAGDAVAAWDTSARAWWTTVADTVAERPDGAGCAAGGPFRTPADSASGARVTRLALRDALPAGVVPGAPVRLARRVRWTIYRASDRQWWLGQRRCAPACGAAQPVAGPLAAPMDSGLRFATDADGAVRVTFRGVRSGVAARVESRTWAVRGVGAVP